MVIKTRERILLFFMIIAIAILAFDSLYYTSQERKIKRLREEVKTADQKLNASLVFNKGVETVEAEVARLERELQGFSERTLRGEEFRVFLKHLARDSDCLRIKIVSLTIKEEEISSPEGNGENSTFQYKRVGVQMVLRSTFDALVAYIKEIEELSFLVSVDHLQIERDKETLPFLKVNMGLSVFIISVPEASEKA